MASEAESAGRRPKCVVTGATGFLGREVFPTLGKSMDVEGWGLRLAGAQARKVDLRSREEVAGALQAARPDMVVHLAAYRDPDFCEEHPDECYALNTASCENLTVALDPCVPVLFVSTDYVFDGTRPPYAEDAVRNPLSVYGRSKMLAEDIILQRPQGIVLRVPLLVGAGKDLVSSGFIAQMHASISQGKKDVADDVLVRYPTWTRDTARVILHLLQGKKTGIWHFSGLEGGTRYQLTRQVAEVLGANCDHLAPSTRIIPRKAIRPANSQLAPSRLLQERYRGFTPFRDVVRSVLTETGVL